jgi:hypothetical protein
VTLARRTPLRRRSAKPKRRPPTRCSFSSRCGRRPGVILGPDERVCPTHATALADRLAGDYVKARDSYRCQLRGFNDQACYRPEAVYWCHLIPKGRYYSTRWEPDNAVTACAGHHKAFDESPVEKDDWILARLGAERWGRLRRIARRSKVVDVAEVVRTYRRGEPWNLPDATPEEVRQEQARGGGGRRPRA